MRLLVASLLACLLAAPSAAAPAPRRGFPPLSSPVADGRFREAMRLYERGLAQQRNGHEEEARALLGQAAEALQGVLRTDPRAWVYYALGQALRLRGDCDAALTAYRTALERLPDEALADDSKAEFASRTKQQIGGCVVEHPTRAGGPEGPRPAPSTSPSPSPSTSTSTSTSTSPSTSPSPSPEVRRSAPRERYSVAAPVVVGVIGLGALAAGGAFYAVSGNRYDELVAAGCGHQIMCLADRYGPTQQMERASIGLMAAGGALVAIDLVLWGLWRRR